MTTSSARQRAMALTCTAWSLSCSLWTSAAFASQGPGAGLGTASSFIQLTMAILVYGAAALVIGVGLIGAVRGH